MLPWRAAERPSPFGRGRARGRATGRAVAAVSVSSIFRAGRCRTWHVAWRGTTCVSTARGPCLGTPTGRPFSPLTSVRSHSFPLSSHTPTSPLSARPVCTVSSCFENYYVLLSAGSQMCPKERGLFPSPIRYNEFRVCNFSHRLQTPRKLDDIVRLPLLIHQDVTAVRRTIYPHQRYRPGRNHQKHMDGLSRIEARSVASNRQYFLKHDS